MSAFREQLLGTGTQALEPGQVDSLDLLVLRPAWRMTDLADALRVDPSTATRAVQRLVRANLARRVADPDDGRVVMVEATAEGRKRQQTIGRGRRAALSVMLSEFDRGEREQLAELMERFVTALDHFTAEAAACEH